MRLDIELEELQDIKRSLNRIENKLDKIVTLLEGKESMETKSTSTEKKLLTLDEANKVYGIALWTLKYKASRREIPITKIGKRVYINVQKFEEWLKKKEIPIYKE